MPENTFAELLKKRRQVSITVTGRSSGRALTRPVWFVCERGALWLLPVYGSRTQWYRNLQADRAITIQAGKERRDFRSRLRKDKRAVSQVVQWFREKYTAAEIKRWYTGLDVAVQVPLAAPRA